MKFEDLRRRAAGTTERLAGLGSSARDGLADVGAAAKDRLTDLGSAVADGWSDLSAAAKERLDGLLEEYGQAAALLRELNLRPERLSLTAGLLPHGKRFHRRLRRADRPRSNARDEGSPPGATAAENDPVGDSCRRAGTAHRPGSKACARSRSRSRSAFPRRSRWNCIELRPRACRRQNFPPAHFSTPTSPT